MNTTIDFDALRLSEEDLTSHIRKITAFKKLHPEMKLGEPAIRESMEPLFQHYLADKTLSTNEVRLLINQLFGFDFSRNTYVGQKDRWGLVSARKKSTAPVVRAIPKRTPKPVVSETPLELQGTDDVVVAFIGPPTEEDAGRFERLTLILSFQTPLAATSRIEEDQCRWPIGDPTEDHSCGRQVERIQVLRGKLYCGYHLKLAHRPTARIYA